MAENETPSSNWPDLTIAFTALTGLVFLSSLFFISGLSLNLHRNITGLCDLADYLRVAPSWMLPSLGWFIYGTLMRLGAGTGQ